MASARPEMKKQTMAAEAVEPAADQGRDTMNVVIVGHVDHGKSTLVGRLLADTGTLGDGKLEKVQETCRRQGKAFEYAFLLDALEEEQGQGITIDAARVFFRTARRDYIIIDAPGHIEFLKNMVTGAARAEAAVLLIDAHEGVRENSRRHGYLLSMLGIRQVIVAVNKIDLVDWDRAVFERIEAEYRGFLGEIGVTPGQFIPISAREGAGVAERSARLSWYRGPTVLEALDGLTKQAPSRELPLRMPVQDVYKFNERGDDRRIIAGRIEAGGLAVGERVVFLPSGKQATVASIEAFSAPERREAFAGESVGITLDQQIYVSRGEIVSRPASPPSVSTKIRVNLFWLGRAPMVPGRRYRLKLGTAATEVTIDEIHRVLDASNLDTTHAKQEVGRHDVADLVLRTRQPIAFDPAADLEQTGRFVIVDGYDIAGGGIIRQLVVDDLQQRRLESRLRDRDWVRGDIGPDRRAELAGHAASMVMVTGAPGSGKMAIARALERRLVESGHRAYLLNGKNLVLGVDADIAFDDVGELVRRFGEVAHLLLDAGLLVISTTNFIGVRDHKAITTQVEPFPTTVVHLGPEAEGLPEATDLRFDPQPETESAVEQIVRELSSRRRLRLAGAGVLLDDDPTG
ncbi:MAG TPA: GTP-binding protein [Kofleriaceae bacterium]|nr:GTP-binding protein [Kofleriaceae bacterium]